MNRKILLSLAFGLLFLTSKAQNTDKEKQGSVVQSIYGMQIGTSGLTIHNENRLSAQFALRTEVGMGIALWNNFF